MLVRREFLTLVGAAGAMLAASNVARAQAYPARTVRIIVPFPAGGPTDVMARLVGQKLSEKLGQQFYVENHAGAGGNIGMGVAAKAPGDGYTILFVSSSYVVNTSLYQNPPYDPDKDFIPITKAGGSAHALFAYPGIPAKSVQELVALIKGDPKKFSVASPGIGTTPHLSSELFKQAFGLPELTIVPFPGGNASIQSVVAGHTPLSLQAIPPGVPFVRDGKLRAFAVTAGKRASSLPDVPTFDELGVKDQEAETMQGVVVPTGTPKEIVDLLYREIARILVLPDVKPKLDALGFESEPNSPAEFAAYIKAEIAKWKRVITTAKIKQI